MHKEPITYPRKKRHGKRPHRELEDDPEVLLSEPEGISESRARLPDNGMFAVAQPTSGAGVMHDDCSILGKRLTDVWATLASQNAVAIDIESNGSDIWQIGLATQHDSRIIYDSGTSKGIADSLHRMHHEAQERLVCGHNILTWDLPILRAHDPGLFVKNPIWDTLVAAWLFEPWARAFALLVDANAHRADADAKAALGLFGKQSARLSATAFGEILNNTSETAGCMRALAARLQLVDDRKYPPLPQWIPQVASGGAIPTMIIPSSLMRELFWVPGVHWDFPAGYADLETAVLVPDLVTKAKAQHPSDWRLAILHALLLDAACNHVSVLVGMIPHWFRAPLAGILPACTGRTATTDHVQWKVITYRALKAYSSHDRTAVCASGNSVLVGDGRFDLLDGPHRVGLNTILRALAMEPGSLDEDSRKRTKVHRQTVRNLLGRDGGTPAAFTVSLSTVGFQLSDLGLTRESTRCNAWLVHDPVLLQNEDASPCSVWIQDVPDRMPQPAVTLEAGKIPLCEVPDWFDSETGHPTSQVFTSSRTIRRREHYSDVLSQLLSLTNADAAPDPSPLFVLLLEHDKDVAVVSAILSDIGLCNLAADHDSVLRYLERSAKDKSKVAVAAISSAARWREAAAQLHVRIRLVFESAPMELFAMFGASVEVETSDPGRTVDGESSPHCLSEDETIYPPDNTDDGDGSDDAAAQRTGTVRNSSASVHRLHVLGDTIADPRALDQALTAWFTSLQIPDALTPCAVLLDPRITRLIARRMKTVVATRRVYKPVVAWPQLHQALKERALDLGDVVRRVAPVEFSQYTGFLESNWGYKAFHDYQEEVVKAVIEGADDVIVRLPTGAGKSITFQVPALLRGNCTQKLSLVICPLRALMQDQVEDLWEKGFLLSADYLSGGREQVENDDVYQRLVGGEIKLLYVAPERFRVRRFQDALQRRVSADGGMEYIIVDEAHCVSQWGFDFRPDYLYALREIRQTYRPGATKMLLLSATITEAIKADLEVAAGLLQNGRAYRLCPQGYTHPVRPFIRPSSSQVQQPLYDKDGSGLVARVPDIREIIKKLNPAVSTMLIFTSRRKHAELLSEYFQQGAPYQIPGIEVEAFHAGMSTEERNDIYDRFKGHKLHVLAATKAFGMGMDIPNIHWCAHLGPPAFLEDYLQEIGRTGRNEEVRKKANLEDRIECVLLHHAEDFETTRTLLQRDKIEPPDIADLLEHLCITSGSFPGTSVQVTVVPADQMPDIGLTGARYLKALYWLEEAGRIRIAGTVQNVLKLRPTIGKLSTLSQGDSSQPATRLAKILLDICGAVPNSTSTGTPVPGTPLLPGQSGAADAASQLSVASPTPTLYRSPEQNADDTASLLRRALGWLERGLGFFLGSHSQPAVPLTSLPSEQTAAPLPHADHLGTSPSGAGADTIEVNVANLAVAVGLPQTDQIFSLLADLQAQDCLVIDRQLEFTTGQSWHYRQILLDWCSLLADHILSTLDASHLSHADLQDLLHIDDSSADTWPNQKAADRAKRRVVASTLILLRDSGVHVREQQDETGSVYLSHSSGAHSRRLAKSRVAAIIAAARKTAVTVAAMLTGDRAKAPLGDLFAHLGTDGRLRQLHQAFGVLARLRICSTKTTTLPWTHLIHILDTTPFPAGEKQGAQADQRCFAMIRRVNDMAILRAYAMELYALAPDDRKSAFVDEYFAIGDVDDMETLIVRWADDLAGADEALDRSLADLRMKVRRGAFDEQFKSLTPEQREVCEAPYLGNLLVNAGPGAGKTQVLVMRIAHLLHRQGLQPQQILILAFNRAVVHEIKDRINTLFRQLGYGSAFAARLQVYTFHAFAKRNMARLSEWADDTALEDTLHAFATKVKEEQMFADLCATGVRAILIDEFQDMNEDFFNLIVAMRRTSGAGLMVIGDDDQDILLWNRRKWIQRYDPPIPRYSANEYFDALKNEVPRVQTRFLRVNFRSTPQIVAYSQTLIRSVPHVLPLATRMKDGVVLKANHDDGPAIVEAHGADDAECVRVAIERRKSCLEAFAAREGKQVGRIALLCRTNRHAARIAHMLAAQRIPYELRGDTAGWLRQLRPIAVWLDICNAAVNEGRNSALSQHAFDTLINEFSSSGISEAGEKQHHEALRRLWDLTIDENRWGSLNDHAVFVSSLRTDDLERLLGRLPRAAADVKIVVSTINKVKGLEFDHVLIPQNQDSFPFGPGARTGALTLFAQEELRLIYVAATRAKHTLWRATGARNVRIFEGVTPMAFTGLITADGLVFEGSLEGEVDISWAARPANDCQDYIREHVAVGDNLVVSGNMYLVHHGRKIGKLANALCGGGLPNNVEVAAIVRYPIKEEQPWGADPKYIARGWLYTVLIKSL